MYIVKGLDKKPSIDVICENFLPSCEGLTEPVPPHLLPLVASKWNKRAPCKCVSDFLSSHLLEGDTCSLVDGSAHTLVPSGVADESPRQHGHHDNAQGAVAHQGEGGQADEEQHARQDVEEADHHEENGWSSEGAEEVFSLGTNRKKKDK